jgi:hypothetical protein
MSFHKEAKRKIFTVSSQKVRILLHTRYDSGEQTKDDAVDGASSV